MCNGRETCTYSKCTGIETTMGGVSFLSCTSAYVNQFPCVHILFLSDQECALFPNGQSWYCLHTQDLIGFICQNYLNKPNKSGNCLLMCILYTFVIQNSFVHSWKDSEDLIHFRNNIKLWRAHWSSTINPPFVLVQSHYFQSLALKTSKCCSARCTQLYGVTGRNIMMLLFIIAPVYHSDIIAPVVFQIYDILAAGAGSYTSHIESGDYKATSCQNNKPDTLSSSHVWLAGTCFSWNEFRSVGFQHPSQSSLIKTSQEMREMKPGLCCVSDRETKLSGGVGPVSKGGRTEQKVSPPAWSATNAFCTPMTPQRRESSLIHVCCTSKCGLDQKHEQEHRHSFGVSSLF